VSVTLSSGFERYVKHAPHVPVVRVTSGKAPTIHRFFDTSPISPSGKYIALTEFQNDGKLPVAGEQAFVIVIDLENGQEIYRSATAAWDTQLGAQAQWGAADTDLFFNRMDDPDTGPYGVKVDINGGTEVRLSGPVYMISPDGRYSASPDLKKIGLVQAGYGVIVAKENIIGNRGAEETDGIFVTDTETGRCRLLISFAQIYRELKPRFSGIRLDKGAFYAFHVKWSPDGKRIMLVLRWLPDGPSRGTKNYLITMRADGSELRMALDAKAWRNGHHPNWCPDSNSIVMNLAVRNSNVRFPMFRSAVSGILRRAGVRIYSKAYDVRFARFSFDGSEKEVLSQFEFGSGHPSLHSDGRYLITDAYPNERVSFGDGSVPLRVLDLLSGQMDCVVRILTKPPFDGPRAEWRVDPHPVWDRPARQVVFNAAADGTRQVYLADFTAYLKRSVEA
jgi:hypothetical protein